MVYKIENFQNPNKIGFHDLGEKKKKKKKVKLDVKLQLWQLQLWMSLEVLKLDPSFYKDRDFNFKIWIRV